MAEINDEIFTYITALHEKQILMLQEKTDELKALIIESDYKSREINHRVNNLKVHMTALEERITTLETRIQVNLTLFDYCVKIVCNWRLWFVLFTLYTCADYKHLKEMISTVLETIWHD